MLQVNADRPVRSDNSSDDDNVPPTTKNDGIDTTVIIAVVASVVGVAILAAVLFALRHKISNKILVRKSVNEIQKNENELRNV